MIKEIKSDNEKGPGKDQAKQYLVSIAEDVYLKLSKVSELTGIPLEKIVNKELNGLITDILRYQLCSIFDSYGILDKLKKNPSLVKQIAEVIDMPENYVTNFKEIFDKYVADMEQINKSLITTLKSKF